MMWVEALPSPMITLLLLLLLIINVSTWMLL